MYLTPAAGPRHVPHAECRSGVHVPVGLPLSADLPEEQEAYRMK